MKKEKDFVSEMQLLQWELETVEQEKEIADKKREIRRAKWSFKKPTTTKIIVAFLFANFTVIEIFSMIAMWHFENLDALYVLITTVMAEPISFAVYAAKAYNETKQEELIKLEREKMQPKVAEDESEEVLG